MTDQTALRKAPRRALTASFDTMAPTGYVMSPDQGAIARFARLPEPRGALRIPLLKLDKHQCRFPVGARSDLYCGLPESSEKPYCSFHAGIAYNRRAVLK